jgi:predicted transcriptional regulator
MLNLPAHGSEPLVMQTQDGGVRELVAEVAAAYFQNSHVTISEIPQVISQIASSLSAVASDGMEEGQASPEGAERPKLTPAQVRRSIRPDALISFEDGRSYRTLTRHLAARGLTPAGYREKWGLPPDYPMVAANYSAARAEMARKLGLGERGLAARAAARQSRAAPRSRPAASPGGSARSGSSTDAEPRPQKPGRSRR